MAKTNEQLAKEIYEERRKLEADKNKPVEVSNGQITGAKIAWMLGAFAVDLTTAYAVWQILFWWYGVAWILAGAGGIVYTDWLRERVGNNDTQKRIAEVGLTVSWLSIVFMAILSGVALVLGMTKNKYIEGFTILFVLGLFLYHVYQSYRYTTLDDDYLARIEEKRAEDAASKRIAEIHRAARIVAARKRADELLEDYSAEHGEAMLAALSKPLAQTKPLAQPTRAFAKDTEAAELQTTNPPEAGKNKRPQN